MQYVDSIFAIKDDIDLKDHNDAYIHIRGGDIFNSNPHRAYVQPPLSYYTKIFQLYDNKFLICEDNRNPCVSKLKQHPKVYERSGSLINDLTILRNATNVVIGFGTFGLLVYFMNKKLQNLYMPKYMKDTFVHGDNWGNDINVHIIDLPSYIPVGEWKNSPEQIKMMLTYK